MKREDEFQTEAECFRQNSLTTKTDVLYHLKFLKREFQNKADKDKNHSSSYYRILDNMMKRMISLVEESHLFEKLEDWWAYCIEISSEGIKLCLQLFSSEYFNEKGEIEPFLVLEEFVLIKLESRLLTVEEYARQYEVNPGTVRQWIRRGKLRAAVKHGNEWRIPELTEPSNRKYKFGQFMIKGHIDGLPEEYSFINDCNYVNFSQDKEDKKLFHISFNEDHEEITCDARERERIELVLIASPDVIYISDGFGNFA